MNARFARAERPADGDDRTVLDVSGVETDRVDEYVGEWLADAEVYFERKGGKTFLVAGE
ncbi:hypothetical protein [Halorussus litoreus]|uniref:hypothetical protein n=1 Tax=Halorussus litoreus TaxID=1710536 RepID=UPI00130083E9|nr:hypothetical protein [Halorussus litoreus]